MAIANREIRDTCIRMDHISYVQSTVAKGGSQIGQTFIPLCEKVYFKHQHGMIPIDPAILAGIGDRFIANNLMKYKFKI